MNEVPQHFREVPRGYWWRHGPLVYIYRDGLVASYRVDEDRGTWSIEATWVLAYDPS